MKYNALVTGFLLMTFTFTPFVVTAQPYQQITGQSAFVTLKDSRSMLLRAYPSVNSPFFLRVPNCAYVEILFYESAWKYVEGRRGRWVKIRYKDHIGWAWGWNITRAEDMRGQCGIWA